ncbi:bifunctional diaminohydroxyphosphoribosylaminopyrimidine deaminase/5-amino-6-(5-phosphoribosylamino)uracil reductase RibD [Vibrio sp. CK2-1]|uniref:bifunctional diaminohydroxyphosphoribosylaminopyrimidine deaminase/5-amino-6-(5-phosphoribosylamino)uracil reductase RibD n=1 Tax=Vibrio sp. CK2-1 TaxID=2912249 RepID=UPI001F029FE9|nr:bifunctional diaminohydroxyphosphoribosylaminopyrimidine deaminase/5-amino-6-(5-phosphoribosylamino)uracil reductase RibD [Vibrio sp. CK2-1]MCF7354276.1 bifunctional diaminohydroxyphosphoribosylaminopyrimidine deaminase/5-amino-6-(5-phosphoribosylamino)uracil reductase RibD [Vibrio sp. CK2-1]
MTQAVFSAFDYQMMTQAIALAKQGIYTTAPNPNVGCVITKEQTVIGQGAHLKAGQPHAEVHALRQAADQTTGATAYVTLEPCSHYGRTPPCAEALIKAQVSRVVCAMQDPNPQVAGRGIQMLREAGIQVDVGLLEQDAINLNPGFIKRMKTGMPFVQLKLAASLDGKTALANGESQWITGPKARQDVQAYRAKSGAILSTAKTVSDDNASLNVRWQDLPESIQAVYQQDSLRQPVRVVLDRQAKLQGSECADLKLWQQQGEILTLHDSAVEVPTSFKAGQQSVVAKVVEQQFDLPNVLKQLADEHNINHIWVEAGAQLAASLIEQNCVDELIVYLAPKLMGTDGRGLTQLCGLSSMSDVIELDIQDVRMVGCDIRLTAAIKKNRI